MPQNSSFFQSPPENKIPSQNLSLLERTLIYELMPAMKQKRQANAERREDILKRIEEITKIATEVTKFIQRGKSLNESDDYSKFERVVNKAEIGLAKLNNDLSTVDKTIVSCDKTIKDFQAAIDDISSRFREVAVQAPSIQHTFTS